jgi:hypothetical protein
MVQRTTPRIILCCRHPVNPTFEPAQGVRLKYYLKINELLRFVVVARR